MCQTADPKKVDEGSCLPENDVVLTFLKQIKDGQYAKIDEKILSPKRFHINVQETGEDDFYYSIS